MRILRRGRSPHRPQSGAVLTDAGYAVDHVIDGEEAWFRGYAEDYDLAVLDLGLPGC